MKHFLKFLFILLPALGWQNGYAQKIGQARIDSLLLELPKAKEDTNKIKLLDTLSFSYSSINPDGGIKLGQQGLELAEKLGWKFGIANSNNVLGINCSYGKSEKMEYYQKALTLFEAMGNKLRISYELNNIGLIYLNQNDLPKASDYFFKALKLAEEMKDKSWISLVISNIGNLYLHQRDYPKSLEYYFNALKLYEEMGDKHGIGYVTSNIANVYTSQSDYPKALEYEFKALKIDEETGDKYSIASVTGNIGRVYFRIGDYPKSLEYLQIALKIDEETNNKQDIASITNTIGNVYLFQGDNPKALEYLQKSLKIYEDIGSKYGIAYVTASIGSDYLGQKNYTMAIENFQKALKMDGENGDKHAAGGNLCNIGECFLSIVKDTSAKPAKLKNGSEQNVNKYQPNGAIPTGKAALLRNAIDYLQRSLAILKEINALDFMQNCYENLADAYKLSGDYKKALDATDNYQAIKDSVFSKEKSKEIVKMEYDRTRLADSLRMEEGRRIEALKLRHQRNYTYISIAGILLLLGFSFFIIKERGKSEYQRKIAESERRTAESERKIAETERKIAEREREKSDNLLLNILPAEIAEELKSKGVSDAKSFDNVTVLFTDFVNFTSAGERMTPKELVTELHTCFKAFDNITTKYDIEKIKTIGDAYLAVCGLPLADPKHAENIIHAALEINQFMQDRLAKFGNSTFNIRIGIHSGSVVAGIVGVKKFAYDIWGDTVNTAARMEQNSAPGRINISETTYDLVKDKFNCEYRGEITAKNKGEMRMYFVG